MAAIVYMNLLIKALKHSYFL